MHPSRIVFSFLLAGTLISQSPADIASSRPLRMPAAGINRDIVHVATFNIRVGRYTSGSRHWSRRRAMVISLLAAEQYDIVGLQEALSYQLDEILQGLPQYDAYAVGRSSEPDKG